MVSPNKLTFLRVLLVEDNVINQRVAHRFLEHQGHSVTIAVNGRDALRILEAERWGFDAVLMDIQMPEMDGLEATREIRRREVGRQNRLPIIALTAHSEKQDRDRGMAAGMDAYLTKPIERQALLASLQCILSDKWSNTVIVDRAKPLRPAFLGAS